MDAQKQDLPGWGDLIKWLIGALQAVLVFVASQMSSDLREATKSIVELNIKMAVLIQSSTVQDSRINALEARVRVLEQNGK